MIINEVSTYTCSCQIISTALKDYYATLILVTEEWQDDEFICISSGNFNIILPKLTFVN